ncbi:MAG: hypothetical protein Q9174_007005, partial [Haloplaca sp. 1 TL-2023]
TAKSLVSFPSLSPENSPSATGAGRFKSSQKSPKTPHTPFKSRPKSPSIVDALVRKTSTFKGRPALFEDSPRATGKDVPGALHHASDEHLQHLIAKNGALTLVRQLAEDLADRDSEITTLRRRAEERERELKRMLREVEVSNLDIETRLHRLESVDDGAVSGQRGRPHISGSSKSFAKDRLASITNGIDQMMGEAMRDNIGTGNEVGSPRISQEQDKQATIRAAGLTSRNSERRSINSSIESHDASKGTVRGWKDYLWSGSGTSRKTSRASSVVPDESDVLARGRGYSGANARRMALDEDFFNPPQPQSQEQTGQNEDAQSVKSTSSMSAWTMKLFAGKPQAGREANRTVRGRSSTTESRKYKTSRAPSAASTQTTPSAMASLMKVNSVDPPSRTMKKSVPPLPLGANSNHKSSPQPSVSQNVHSPKATDSGGNLGPVEMDTILPLETRPPAQTQLDNKNQGTEFLTDRFGFIYDQRRKRQVISEPRSPKHRHKHSISSGGLEMLRKPGDPLKSNAKDSESGSTKADSIHRPATPGSTGKSEEKPAKRWQDYLKVATFPTELLSHTPSSKPITTVVEADQPSPLRRTPTFGDTRGSLPSASLNPEPSASTITAEHAEMARPGGDSTNQASAVED